MLTCGEAFMIIVFILVHPCRFIRESFVDLKRRLIPNRTLLNELKAYFVTSDEDFKDVEIVDCGKLLKRILIIGDVACVRFRSFLQKKYGIFLKLHQLREYENLNFSAVE